MSQVSPSESLMLEACVFASESYVELPDPQPLSRPVRYSEWYRAVVAGAYLSTVLGAGQRSSAEKSLAFEAVNPLVANGEQDAWEHARQVGVADAFGSTVSVDALYKRFWDMCDSFETSPFNPYDASNLLCIWMSTALVGSPTDADLLFFRSLTERLLQEFGNFFADAVA